jgi:hypothetical protein
MAVIEKNGNVLYAGLVIEVKRTTVQVMSDIWEDQIDALVWDTDVGRPMRKFFWLDAFAEVDASDEILAQYYQYEGLRRYEEVKEKRIESIQKEANTPGVGKTVKIVAGRDAGLKGKTGKVFHNMYRPYQNGWRASQRLKVGVAFSDEMVDVVKNGRTFKAYKDHAWVWGHNVQVLDADAAIAAEMASVEFQATEAMQIYVVALMKHQPTRQLQYVGDMSLKRNFVKAAAETTKEVA